jgi:hypothetical protein
METSSCLGGRILAMYEVILAIRAVLGHFFEQRKSGGFTGFIRIGFRETGAESGSVIPRCFWGGGFECHDPITGPRGVSPHPVIRGHF